MTRGIIRPAFARPLRVAVCAAVLLLPVNAGAPALAEDAAPAAASVAGNFDHLAIPKPRPQVSAGAVDITAIDIPVEEEARGTPLGSGIASYYGRRFHGRLTASGQRFDMHAMTAAHRTLPFGSQVRVTNPRSGRSVVVTINDRGPYAHGRTIDLSRAAATEIGLIRRGHGNVDLELIS